MDPGDRLASWAFALSRSIGKVVQEQFPSEARSWPTIQTFYFEGYTWHNSHLVVILRDKLSGIPSGGSVKPLEDEALTEPPSVASIPRWHDHLSRKFNLRPQDALVVVPLVEPAGRVEEEFAKWSDSDKQLWRTQVEIIVMTQMYYVKGLDVTGGFFIPPGYMFLANECRKFFFDHPDYTKNVFIMTRLVEGNKLLEELDRELMTTLSGHGLDPVRADDKMYLDDRNLWNNVCVYLICCKYGIAILEDRVKDEFNPNVAIEYGFMRGLNKPVLLLTDVGFHNLRADIIGTLRGEFDITDIKGTIRKPVEKWLRDLGII